VAKVPDWIYRQSAVIAYRRRPRGVEVLLITSRKGTRWVLPKGVVEPGLSPATSAAKEALEEAGVRGTVN
jgi:phosphohistidine phosphatase